MKILNLLEAKFSKSEYAFHATDGNNLKSILKHGLIPNKNEGGYGSDDYSEVGYELTPLSGVYFTTKFNDAKYIARSISYDSIIIIAKIQSRNTEIDEDRLISDIIPERYFRKTILDAVRPFKDKYGNIDFANHSEKIDRIINDILQDIVNDVISSMKRTYKVSEKIIHYVRQDIIEYVSALMDYILNDLNGEHLYSDNLKNKQNTLTKKLKNIQHQNRGTFHTFKIDQTIGFSGANRIVGIYSPENNKGWGDTSPVIGNVIQVKHPLEVIQ